MHHSLKFYSGHRRGALRLYMFGAWGTRVPLLGRLVRRIANGFGASQHRAYLLTAMEADGLIEAAGCVAVGPCDCRRVFNKCHNPVETEILLGSDHHTLREAMPPGSREIGKAEAREILLDCRRRGLIQTVIKCRDTFYAICSCCSCCCVPLRLSKGYGVGNALVRHKDIVAEFKGSLLPYQD